MHEKYWLMCTRWSNEAFLTTSYSWLSNWTIQNHGQDIIMIRPVFALTIPVPFFLQKLVTERRPIKKKVIPFFIKVSKSLWWCAGENFAQCGIIAADPSPSEEGGKDQKKRTYYFRFKRFIQLHPRARCRHSCRRVCRGEMQPGLVRPWNALIGSRKSEIKKYV